MANSDVRSVHPFRVGWSEIRSVAVEFASRGWPVLPGTYQLLPSLQWLGKPDAKGLEPVMAQSGTTVPTTDPALVREWWTRRPYSVLLSCGNSVDALEVPSRHGEGLRQALHAAGCSTPIAITPFDTFLIFISAGTPLRRELAEHCRLHAHGTWVALPPTSHVQIPYWWLVSPSAVHWTLARSGDAQAVVSDALRPRARGRHALTSTAPTGIHSPPAAAMSRS